MAIRVRDGEAYDAPDIPEPLCDWPILMDCTPAAALDADLVEWSKAQAANIMNQATARRYGVCISTFAPLPGPCDGTGHQDNWHLVDPKIGQFDGSDRFNAFYNRPACEWYGCCADSSNTKIKLWHTRVVDILRVVIDGVILDPDNYFLQGNTLIRTDGSGWPTSQAELPQGSTGTWSITYRHGIPLPVDGQFATGVLACEIAMAAADDDSCSLPTRTKTYTNHAGITLGFIDPLEFLDKGRTGLAIPDQWILAENPKGIRRRARAFSYRKRQHGAIRLVNPVDLAAGFPAVYTGDIGETVDVILDGVDNLDLLDSIEAHVWTGDEAVTTLDVTVVSSSDRRVRVDLGATGADWLPTLVHDQGEIVLYNLQIEVTWTDASESTWPADILTVIGSTA